MGDPATAVPTGNPVLDEALGAGIPHGSLLLVEGDHGAGFTEFALTVLQAACRAGTSRRVRLLSGVRAGAQVRRDLRSLFSEEKPAAEVEIEAIAQRRLEGAALDAAAELGAGDLLAVESAAALLAAPGAAGGLDAIRSLAESAVRTNGVVLVLASRGTLTDTSIALLAEVADGVLSFRWRDGGTTLRRTLTIQKFVGLPPLVAGEEVPVFEVALEPGIGVHVSRVKSVL